MPEEQGRVRRIVTRIVNDDNLDLYTLGLAALAFTVLGNLGISDLKTLLSALLGLLALLAYSQIRSRRQMSSIVKSQRPDPASLFSDDFPPDLIPRRASATDWLLIGTSLSRTVQTTRIDMRRVLSSGARVRILVMDPTDDALAAAAEARYPNLPGRRLQNRILTTLDDLALIKEESMGGRLEIRVLPWPPKIGINALDLGKPTGVLYVQHYEHKPTGEAGPIFRLEAADGPWHHHFAAEALRLWEDGTPWPLTAEQHLSRRRRPIFMESFSSEVEATVGDAKDLLITGVTRNTLINSNYGKFEKLLLTGCRIRFLLVDPDSEAIAIVADRYYAERSVSSAQERVRHALRLLTELQRATGGDLSVRLTSHPLAIGLIAVNSTAELRTVSSALLMEYYTYRSAGEPKLVLQPADDLWFQHFVEEAEALWASAAPFTLTSSAERGDIATS